MINSAWSGLRQYASSSDYPGVHPTKDTLNRIVEAFLSRTTVLRRAALISGRWGTPIANQAVARAIQSLSFANGPQSGFVAYLSLREFGSSICFYWNMAGLLDRGEWVAVRALQALEIETHTGKMDAVSVFPFLTYKDVDWKFLTDYERSHTAISSFLAPKFVAEARDIALSEMRADELFDQTELVIALGYVHRRLAEVGRATGMPVGRFSWKGGTLEAELKRIEALPDSDVFFQAGMLGGSKATAIPTLQKVREIQREISKYW